MLWQLIHIVVLFAPTILATFDPDILFSAETMNNAGGDMTGAASNSDIIHGPAFRPASAALLGGKPAPKNAIDLIGQQCNLDKCFDIFKTIHPETSTAEVQREYPGFTGFTKKALDSFFSPDAVNFALHIADDVKSCLPAFEDCINHLNGFIENIKKDRGIPDTPDNT
ncbi:hypothetical protein NQ176_g7337 [Zarea fungicola]|uniref:Uncharacterized protein n=1 Tax=Zarea fungicola TaxID=93591 RepID=A0ACC1MZP6_9HYPO|nr:hypothetical protein NQ176_g7337 [Lecanicillium fungicola]